jgi:hypothetical protein
MDVLAEKELLRCGLVIETVIPVWVWLHYARRGVMRVVFGLSIAAVLAVTLFAASAVAQKAPARPPGVAEDAWISIAKDFGFVLMEEPLSAPGSAAARGQFMVLRDGRWLAVEPVLHNRVQRATTERQD